jgi:alkylation response protein AidB-like acyl-CoA dehydrogenase
MRYYFHTVENGARVADDDGVDLADDAEAKVQATQFLAEIASDAILTVGGLRFCVEVLGEDGALVTAMGFTLEKPPDEDA